MNFRIGVLVLAGLAGVGLASATIIGRSDAALSRAQQASGATAPSPMALAPPPGTVGPMGPRGPAGFGALLWRDATGRVIGPPDIDSGGPHHVFLTYAGLRVRAQVFANVTPWGTGTFENPQLSEQVPWAYYETSDCSGTAYFAISAQPFMTLGTDAPAITAINAQGQAYLLILDPQDVRQRLVRCYRVKDEVVPLAGAGAVLGLSSPMLALTPPLSMIHPGPLTLR